MSWIALAIATASHCGCHRYLPLTPAFDVTSSATGAFARCSSRLHSPTCRCCAAQRRTDGTGAASSASPQSCPAPPMPAATPSWGHCARAAADHALVGARLGRSCPSTALRSAFPCLPPAFSRGSCERCSETASLPISDRRHSCTCGRQRRRDMPNSMRRGDLEQVRSGSIEPVPKTCATRSAPTPARAARNGD